MESKTDHKYKKKLYDLKPIESKGISEVLFNNAKQLRNDALLIYETNKSYGSATSLLVLSSEEAIKAILVLLHCEGYNVYKIQDARKFFFDHKIRHQLAQLIELTSGFFESVQKFENREPVKLFKIKNEFWDTVINGFVDAIKSVKPFLESTKRIKDLENFNDNKNNGFYVDYRDKLITPKDEITEIIYLNTKEIVDRIFKVYKIVRVLYHPCICNRKDQKEIEDIKNQMKIYIDESMKDFSFKELSVK